MTVFGKAFITTCIIYTLYMVLRELTIIISYKLMTKSTQLICEITLFLKFVVFNIAKNTFLEELGKDLVKDISDESPRIIPVRSLNNTIHTKMSDTITDSEFMDDVYNDFSKLVELRNDTLDTLESKMITPWKLIMNSFKIKRGLHKLIHKMNHNTFV